MTLIFSIHYFLWYGSLTTIFGYEMVYARQYTNSTTIQFGYLNMILPFVTVVTTPIICSMADRNRCHRTYFTISLVLTTICLCLYAALPLLENVPAFKTKESQINRVPGTNQVDTSLHISAWIYFCVVSLLCDLSMGVNTCLSDSFAVLQAEESGTSFGRVIVWGTFGWAATALALCGINQWSVLPRLVPGILFGAILLALDVVIVSFWKRSTDFKLDLIPSSAAQTMTGSASSAHKDPSDYMPMNESAKINLGNEEREGVRLRKTKSPLQLISENDPSVKGVPTVTIILKKKSPKLSEIQTVNSNDRASSEIDEEMGEKSPRSGISSSSGAKTASSGYSRLDKLPGNTSYGAANKRLASSSLISQADTILVPTRTDKQVSALKRKDYTKVEEEKAKSFASFKMQLILLSLILKRRTSLIRYLVLFVLSGFFMSMHWNYFFLYLEQIYYHQFEIISALSMVGQSVFGELPFFILSRKFINHFGRSHTLSISIISIGVRFLLYKFFLPNVNMYCIVIADCFQGPNYGLFYVIMTEVGLEYSFCDDGTIDKLAARGYLDKQNSRQVDTVRLSLRSTVQSVAFACYEGLGVGLGSLVGGWIVHSYGFETLWLSMAVGSITVGLLNVLVELFWGEDDVNDNDANSDREVSERSEYYEARRKGTLKKVAKPRPFPPAPPVSLNSLRVPQSPDIKLKMLLKNKITPDKDGKT